MLTHMQNNGQSFEIVESACAGHTRKINWRSDHYVMAERWARVHEWHVRSHSGIVLPYHTTPCYQKELSIEAFVSPNVSLGTAINFDSEYIQFT